MGEKKEITILVTTEDEQLVKRTLRRVSAAHLRGGTIDSEAELYHYGLIGLIEAKRSYDRSKKIPFPAFAIHRIRGAMIDHLRKAPMVRLPQKKQELRKQVEAARQELRNSSVDDGEEQLAAHLGWTVAELREVEELQTGTVSLVTKDREGDCPPSGWDLPDRGSGPEAGLLQRELAVIVHECLERISSARDRLILEGRLLHERKLRELADCFGCTMETIRLRQQKAMESMKRCLESNGWDGDNLSDITG